MASQCVLPVVGENPRCVLALTCNNSSSIKARARQQAVSWKNIYQIKQHFCRFLRRYGLVVAIDLGECLNTKTKPKANHIAAHFLWLRSSGKCQVPTNKGRYAILMQFMPSHGSSLHSSSHVWQNPSTVKVGDHAE